MMCCSLAFILPGEPDSVPLLPALLEPFCSSFDDLLVCCARPPLLLHLGVRLVAPLVPGTGPLPNIHAALVMARQDLLLCVLPAASLTPEDLQPLKEHSDTADVVALSGDLLPARFCRGCIKPLERHLMRQSPGPLPRGLHVTRV